MGDLSERALIGTLESLETAPSFPYPSLSVLLGAALPRIAASALKILPGIGWVGGTMAQAALSGAATWALGNTLRDRLSDPHPERAFPPDDGPVAFSDIARSLARAERLRRRGMLSEQEYERVRTELLNAV